MGTLSGWRTGTAALGSAAPPRCSYRQSVEDSWQEPGRWGSCRVGVECGDEARSPPNGSTRMLAITASVRSPSTWPLASPDLSDWMQHTQEWPRALEAELPTSLNYSPQSSMALGR